jgi:hypothetical protein
MKSLIIILTFLGIIGIAIGYVNQLKKCPPAKIEYRYIPRTFQQDQENPVKISELFHTLFTEPSPWIRGVIETPSKNSEINRYFISQG